MKIRELLAGVNPDVCGTSQYFNSSGAPVCPIGHGLARLGESPNHWRSDGHTAQLIDERARALGLDLTVLGVFINHWDPARCRNHEGPGPTNKMIFDRALAAAEAKEASFENT